MKHHNLQNLENENKKQDMFGKSFANYNNNF